MRARCAFLLTLVACGAGCGVEPPAAAPDPFDGAPRLSYDFVPLSQRTGRVGWQPDLIIDERGDDLNYALGEAVPRVAVAADGRIWVLDSSGFRVQVFEPSGEFAFGFGSQGQGPCEFDFSGSARRLRPAFTFAGNELYILSRPQRFSLWDRQGNCTAELEAELMATRFYGFDFSGIGSGRLVGTYRYAAENTANGVAWAVGVMQRQGERMVARRRYFENPVVAARMNYTVDPPDRLYVAHRGADRTLQRLIAYDIDAGPLWVVEMPWPRTRMGAAKLSVDGHGHVYLILGNIVERDGESPLQMLDIFDADGERIRATTIDVLPVERIWQDRAGELQYGIDQHPATGEWRIVRWRLLEDFE